MSLFDLLKFKKPAAHLTPEQLGSLLAGEVTDQYKSDGHYKHPKDNIETADKLLNDIRGYEYSYPTGISNINLETKTKVIDDYIQSLVTQIEALETVPVDVILFTFINKPRKYIYYYEISSTDDKKLFNKTKDEILTTDNLINVYLDNDCMDTYNVRYITDIKFFKDIAPIRYMHEFTELTDELGKITTTSKYSNGKISELEYDKTKVDELYDMIIKQ